VTKGQPQQKKFMAILPKASWVKIFLQGCGRHWDQNPALAES